MVNLASQENQDLRDQLDKEVKTVSQDHKAPEAMLDREENLV